VAAIAEVPGISFQPVSVATVVILERERSESTSGLGAAVGLLDILFPETGSQGKDEIILQPAIVATVGIRRRERSESAGGN